MAARTTTSQVPTQTRKTRGPGVSKAAQKQMKQSSGIAARSFVQGYDRKHPFNNEENAVKLQKHCFDRMQMTQQIQNAWANRCRNIDVDINAFLKLDDEDKKRRKDNLAGKAPKPTAMKMPLALVKIQELQTFLMEVFYPNTGMHAAYAHVQEQELANQFALLLNKQSEKLQHYRKIGKWIFDSLKYNMAVLVPEWQEYKGTRITNDATQRVKLDKDQTLYAGNCLENVDMYNFYWDPAVAPCDVAKQGEWFAYVKMNTWHHAKKQEASGNWVDVGRFENGGPQGAGLTYYNEHPVVRFDYDGQTVGSVDWFKFAGQQGSYGTVKSGNETCYMYIWLDPSEFGLSDDKEFQIWRLTWVNSQYLVDAERMNNAHEMLPLCCIEPNEDNLNLQRKSFGELILNFQDFASFLMNVHIQGSRKKIWGLTIYDPNIVDLSQIGDDAVGRVAVKPSGYGKDLTKSVHSSHDSIDTNQTMQDIGNIIKLLEELFPTSILKQVTDLDRATTFQAAATVQGSNRQNIFIAKMIDDQGIKPLRFMMAANTLQYQQDMEMIDPASGQKVSIAMAQLRAIDFDFIIGEGLQSIDRLMIIHLLKDTINAIIQNKEAAAEFDVPALINYWTDLFGVRTNLNQFKRKQLPMAQQVQAGQDQQQADAASLEAAANAAAVTQGAANAGQAQ